MHPQVDKTAAEAGKVLDTLAALSIELACRCDVPPQELVLDAATLKDACQAIDDAVASLKRILAIEATGRSGAE